MLASTKTKAEKISPYSTVSSLIDSFSHETQSQRRSHSQHTEPFDANSREATKQPPLEVPASQNKPLQIINLRTPREQALKRLSDVVENDRVLTIKELATIHHQFSLVSAD